jgi:hypothetical protein
LDSALVQQLNVPSGFQQAQISGYTGKCFQAVTKPVWVRRRSVTHCAHPDPASISRQRLEHVACVHPDDDSALIGL